jgi:hypothetical protein
VQVHGADPVQQKMDAGAPAADIRELSGLKAGVEL